MPNPAGATAPNPAGATAPILIGVLYDFPQGDGGVLFEEAVHLGLAEVRAGGRLDRPVELVSRQAHGLPAGTAHDVARTFAAPSRSSSTSACWPSWARPSATTA
jgi:hypothetical protein